MKAKKTEEINVSLVITAYNNKELLMETISSVSVAKKIRRNRLMEIIVVDDCSNDGLSKLIKKNFKDIRVIKHSKIRGLMSSLNTGARAARGKVIVFLTPGDKPNKNFLVKTLKNFKNPNIFGISFGESGQAGFYDKGFVKTMKIKNSKKKIETFYISAKRGIFRRDYWMELNGMDEALMVGSDWVDVDLSYRAAKRGLINLWDPAISLTNENPMSSYKKSNKVFTEQNRLIFQWRNLTSKSLFKKHIIGLVRRILRDPTYIVVVVVALSKLSNVLHVRKKEIRETKFSDESIFAKF